MKICSHCKTENKDDANFCRQCGFIFPGFKAKSGNADVSLMDKVNELQQRVKDSENNICNLNSRVSSLVADKQSLQNQLSRSQSQLQSANNSLSSERKKAADAQKEVDEAIKQKEAAESSKGTLHVLYIIVIVAISIFAIVQCNGKQSSESEVSDLNNQLENLNNTVSSLKSKNASLTSTKNSLSNILSKIGANTPLFVGEISIKNKGDSYGSSIYSSNNTYINPKAEIFSLVDGRVDIDVKFFTPYGMSTGSSSPSGYSYSDYFYMNKNQSNTCEFSGWGSNDGNWSSGNYRFEFYYQGRCIGSKSFTIY